MPSHTSGRRLAAVLLVTAAALSACADTAKDASRAPGSPVAEDDTAPTAFHGTLLDRPANRPELTLLDTARQPFSLTRRPDDEVTVLFFGYTHCPDVCPTTMADLAAARRQLPPDVREQVTVAFVTEDPQRDTPLALRRWLDQFDTSFVGLQGGNESTQAALAELYLPQTEQLRGQDGVIEHPHSGQGHDEHGDYTVEHTGIVYAFGPGNSTVIYTGGTSPVHYAEDFTRLAESA